MEVGKEDNLTFCQWKRLKFSVSGHAIPDEWGEDTGIKPESIEDQKRGKKELHPKLGMARGIIMKKTSQSENGRKG